MDNSSGYSGIENFWNSIPNYYRDNGMEILIMEIYYRFRDKIIVIFPVWYLIYNYLYSVQIDGQNNIMVLIDFHILI